MDNEYHTKFDDVLTEVDAAKADAAKAGLEIPDFVKRILSKIIET